MVSAANIGRTVAQGFYYSFSNRSSYSLWRVIQEKKSQDNQVWKLILHANGYQVENGCGAE